MPIPFEIDRRLLELNDVAISRLYRECTPRVLVVTDTLNFDPNLGFGLTQFVNTLKAATIHGMTPIVKTASRYGSPGADLPGFDFKHPTDGLTTSRYDVLFLLGKDTEGAGDLPADQVEVIAKFMQDGGGVFATGDHETLGAALCGDLPRVRNMRKWKAADAPPDIRNENRHSTNLSGSDETEEFDDQSDRNPQRLYLNYRTRAGGTVLIDRAAHPLMQMIAPRKVLEVFPDHPHEGECRLPASLAGGFPLGGGTATEWPKDAAGADVAPEIVAYSVSHGDGFPMGPTGAKEGLVPKLFAAVAAYDGHRARVGRVVTDATWHHFVNINLDGTESPLTGLQSPAGADTDALVRIRRYYVNLATWLMPQRTRRCLRFPLVLKELVRFPLFEELDLPRPPEPIGPGLRQLGDAVMRSMLAHRPAWEAQSLADDALEDALGAEAFAKLDAERRGIAGQTRAELGQAALGGLVAGIVDELAALKSAEEIVPHKSFEERARAGARNAVVQLLQPQRDELTRVDRLLASLGERR
jgi:hypothetical protein